MTTSTLSTNGHTASQTDADLDVLYSWIAPRPTPQTCPEATFSLTLKGRLGGQEAMLTARGQSAEEFKRNLEAIKGVLDPLPTPAPASRTSQGPGWCAKHGVEMQHNDKDGRSWWSHKTDQGWCKGK